MLLTPSMKTVIIGTNVFLERTFPWKKEKNFPLFFFDFWKIIRKKMVYFVKEKKKEYTRVVREIFLFAIVQRNSN